MHNSKILVFVLMLAVSAFGSGIKKYAGEFLYTGVGSRALAMGGAQTAVAEDATAGYWNPAGLMRANGLNIHFMHARQFISSIQYDYIAASHPFGTDKMLALSLVRLGVSNIIDSQNAGIFHDNELIDIDESKLKTFSAADYAFLVSYAQHYNQNWDIGANMKLIYRDYYKESALGIGFDAAVTYNYFDNFKLGAIIRDISTTMMTWSTGEKEFIAPSVRAGISYTYLIKDLDLYFQPAMDLGALLESRDKAAQLNMGPLSLDTFWGMEIGYANSLFLRLGYDDLNRMNGGIGLDITKIGVDYSYTSFDQELGNVHRISFRLKLAEL